MRNLILAGAAALSFAAVPAIAQTTMSMTTEQQTMYDGWTAENRAMYDAWPATYRTYYWTLTPQQQTGWWALNDDQRTRVYAMTPDQRTAAWASITSQMAGSTMPATTSTSTSMSADASMSTMSSGNMQFVRREMTQPVAASADAAALASGDLPVCKANQQDGCINSWEKNKTGTRPLNYWPGKPASEIPGKKPMG